MWTVSLLPELFQPPSAALAPTVVVPLIRRLADAGKSSAPRSATTIN
jgi:hypothetical protein